MSSIYDFCNKRENEVSYEGILESAEVDAIEIEDFEAFHTDMVRESAIEFAQMQGGMYVSELLIENAMFASEEANVEELLENAVTDFIDNAIAKVKKLWAQLVAWFKHVIEMVKNFFTSGKKLVSERKTDLQNAAQKHGASYKFKSYNLDPGKLAGTATDMLAKLTSADAKGQEACIAIAKGDKVNTADIKKDLLTSIGCDKASKVSETIQKASRGGLTSKISTTVSAISLGKLITMVEGKETIKDIKKANDDLNKSMKEAISSLDNMKKAKTDNKKNDENSKKAASAYSEIVRYGATLRSSVTKAHVSELKYQASEATSILRGLLNYNGSPKQNKAEPTKENFNNIYDLLQY